MEQVFSLNNTSPLRIALKEEGVENLNDFLSLTSDIIDEFKYTYKDADDTLITAPVPRGHRRIIIVFFDLTSFATGNTSTILLVMTGSILPRRSLIHFERALST